MVVQHGACAVLFIDLDDFKIINDSLGHLVGDQFLVEIARRLKSVLPDDALIGRFGGDEFIIVLEDAVTSHIAIDVAERIHAALDVPLTLTRREVMATASIGVAVLDHPNMHPEVLLRNASMAMYQAKMRGRAQTVLYDVGMYDRATERLQLETDLRRAIDQGEMCVCYQPIVRLANGQIVGFEALTRWQHPQRGLVFPGTFIPVAEASGLIIPLGRRVIETVCRQIAAWQRDLADVQQLVVNVNISGREFVCPDLVESIAHSLQTNHLDARHLELEITETVAMDHAEMAAATLRQLRSLGLHVALDDFGTGYSSLRYLQQFPIQTIKIDASFISMLTQNEENIAIVEAIISLAHTLGMTVVAEGIETHEQLSYLQHLGCDYGQGFFFSKAVDSDTATDRLVRGGYSEMFLSREAGTRLH
jgi:diguanylate cyclase (GGDEF)-like protein